MKVLLQGLPFFCDYAVLSLYRGPHEIRTLSAKHGTATHYKYNPAEETYLDVLNRIAKEWTPDLFLCWNPENDPPPLGVEDSPIPTVAIAGDWNLFHAAQHFNLARYDVVLSDKPGVPILATEWVTPYYVLPLYAANPLVHRPHPVTRDIDVLYIGNLNIIHRKERAWLLDRLARLSNRYNIAIIGGLFGEDYAQTLSRARIVFNRSVRGELNLRVFETMACGALAMLEDSNQEVRDWFTDGLDIVLFNERNIEEKIIYYLENSTERERIAANGLRRVQEFAPEKRLDDLLNFVASVRPSGRRFKELSPAERLFQDYLQYAFRMEPEYYPVQEKLAAQAVTSAPEDPRAWSILGQTLLRTPPEQAGEPHLQAERCLKVFLRALRLDPDCATLALNAATACKYCGADDLERGFLEHTLKATSSHFPEYLIGDYLSPLWTRWLYALARHNTSLAMLHAEAHVRLAHFLVGNDKSNEAVEHLNIALALDPENTSGVWLRGELLWEQNHREEAANFLYEHLSDFPLHAGFRQRLAAMFAELGETEKAQRLLFEARLLPLALDRTRAQKAKKQCETGSSSIEHEGNAS